MSNPIIEDDIFNSCVTAKLAEQKYKIRIRIAKQETNLDEHDIFDIFDIRVKAFIAKENMAKEDKIRIAKLEKNLNKHDIFDVRVKAFIAKENMAKEDEKNKCIILINKTDQEN